MPNYLILQVLGNSDITIESSEAKNSINNCRNLEDFNEEIEILEELTEENIHQVDFPLIGQLDRHLKGEANLHFGIILTDQREWVKYHNIRGQTFSDVMSSDGYWWRNILSNWCENKGINCHLIPLPIQPDLDNGVANWDGMARTIETLLSGGENPKVSFKNNTIAFQSEPDSGKINFNKIIIQHSSGTPALSSALYLWGVEQKLANQPVEFVYLSRQDTAPNLHTGNHWQWRLKVPQIRQLLDIQDFAGARELVTETDRQPIRNQLGQLDRAVSFNLSAQASNFSKPKDDIIERIAIALWSEKAFRDRGQWMHWYLRVAGAFELAILCLIERQGSGKYCWEATSNNIVLNYQQSEQNKVEFKLSISTAVWDLLSRGVATDNHRYNVDPVSDDPSWENFVKNFYCKNWLQFNEDQNQRVRKGFITLRNELYHSLRGDIIDRHLDEETKRLGSVTHPDHPSQIAIAWLNYIVKLADISTDVNRRVKHYQNIVNEIEGKL